MLKPSPAHFTNHEDGVYYPYLTPSYIWLGGTVLTLQPTVTLYDLTEESFGRKDPVNSKNAWINLKIQLSSSIWKSKKGKK